MSTIDPSQNGLSPRCAAALREFDRRVDEGTPVDRTALLENYADVADELRRHFDIVDLLDELRPSIAAPGTDRPPPASIESFGDYEILEELGRGGMAVVYKARQQSLDRFVALKFPHGGALATAAAADRFRHEAMTLARLRHPHIVTIHEVGEQAGRTYLSMEYVEGTDLARLLRDEPPSIRQAVELARSIAHAIQFAHEQGIVHRDLKPANILVDRTGIVRVADFGLGKVLETDHSLTQTGQILGTLRYMPPEHADGDSDRSPEAGDIYAIGAILYELLSGRPAFWANSTAALVRQIFEQEPVALRQLNSNIPLDLETICLKCLNKKPAERYATAGELADDLQRFLDGEPIAARSVGRVEKLWRWCRRRPMVAGMIGTTSVSTLAGVIVSGYFWHAAIRDRQEAIDAKRRADQNARTAMQQEVVAQRELARSEILLYASQIARAQKAWDDADVAGVWEALSACKPELRGWEHDYFFTRVTENHRNLRGHTRKVKSLSFTPDGRRLVSGSWDDTIKVWDVTSGTELLTIRGHTDHIESVAVSPDGRSVVSAARDNTARIWDLETGRELLAFRNHADMVFSARFTPDGTRVVSGGRDRMIRIWDAATGAEVRVLSGHTGDVDTVAVHPDGHSIASGGDDKTVRTWDSRTGEEIQLFPQRDDVNCVAFSRDGRCLVAGTRGGLTLVRLPEGQSNGYPESLQQDHGGITEVAFATDNYAHHFLSASYNGTFAAWEEPFTRSHHTFVGHAKAVFSITSSDTLKASGGDDGTIKLWHVPKYDPVNRILGHVGNVTCVDISPDGRWMFSGGADDVVRTWDLTQGSRVDEITFVGHADDVTGLVNHSKASWIASCSADGTVKIWDRATASVKLTLPGHDGGVNCLARIPNANRLVSGGEDAMVRVWDADSGRQLATLTGHAQAVTCIAVSPDGRSFCTGSADHTLRLWNAGTGQSLRTFTGHTDRIRCVAFTLDGQRIVSGSNDRLLKVWDVATGIELNTLRGHTDSVSGVACSPNGRRIVSIGHDHALKVWESGSGEQLLSLKGDPAAVRCIQFTPDGRHIITGGENHKITLWDASAHYTDDARP